MKRSGGNIAFTFKGIALTVCKAGDEVDIVLLGNKCDKESERVVPKHKGEKLAWEHGIPFFETSAKDNVNIEDAFSVLTKEILEKWKEFADLNKKPFSPVGSATGLRRMSSEQKRKIHHTVSSWLSGSTK
ncbi:hypothetical protein CIB84_009584 [Bambusicola thoracicus]|uniref:small monomeric GTPase n=1 Tax=Bambusicola thoracicus TaxID=9083 RepID=A0A2P4SRC4_BAMTH|nr:hypothetical protein CIB84_009584 [Bambusicola thoracicus]